MATPTITRPLGVNEPGLLPRRPISPDRCETVEGEFLRGLELRSRVDGRLIRLADVIEAGVTPVLPMAGMRPVASVVPLFKGGARV